MSGVSLRTRRFVERKRRTYLVPSFRYSLTPSPGMTRTARSSLRHRSACVIKVIPTRNRRPAKSPRCFRSASLLFARELDKWLPHQSSQFPRGLGVTQGAIGFAVSSVYHFGHEEGTRPQISPSVTANAKQKDLGVFHSGRTGTCR